MRFKVGDIIREKEVNDLQYKYDLVIEISDNGNIKMIAFFTISKGYEMIDHEGHYELYSRAMRQHE